MSSTDAAAVHLSNHFTDYSNDEESQQNVLSEIPELPPVSIAPDVESAHILQVLANKDKGFKGSRTELLNSNLPANEMHAPLQGPLLPRHEWGGLEHVYHKNTITGNVEHCHVSQIAFEIQRKNFQREGIAADPSDFSRPAISSSRRSRGSANPSLSLGPSMHGNQIDSRSLVAPSGFAVAVTPKQSIANEPYYQEQSQISRKRQKRMEKGDPGSDTYKGPWAPPADEEERKAMWMAEATKIQEQISEAVPSIEGEDVNVAAPIVKEKITSVFHGDKEVDYKGRRWLDRPQGWKERDDNMQDYLPKRLIHTYVGHTTGVQTIRFFPISGHLLLSSSMDSTVKIWDLHNKRTCLRTYMGHSLAVRDIQWADEGRKFYSCSYDKNICLWDTEYGKIIGTFTNDKIPYCVAVHPQKGQDHVFVIGSQSKRAVQFDARTGEITLEYNEHLGAVNTVTFTESGNRLVTTSDDKKMFIWEFGLPVVVKHIAEPHMHSIPAVRLHPNEKFLACQSMDNQVLIYEAAGRYRFQGTKRFRGHESAGYAILPGFSTDGRFIMSGDVSGKVWFWDWKTMKNHRTLQAHDRVCMGSEWHPTMASRIATCGLDGTIKLWD